MNSITLRYVRINAEKEEEMSTISGNKFIGGFETNAVPDMRWRSGTEKENKNSVRSSL